MAIVLDAMGSDNYPDPEIQAAVDAARIIKDEIILVGHEEQLKEKLAQINTDNQACPYRSRPGRAGNA